MILHSVRFKKLPELLYETSRRLAHMQKDTDNIIKKARIFKYLLSLYFLDRIKKYFFSFRPVILQQNNKMTK